MRSRSRLVGLALVAIVVACKGKAPPTTTSAAPAASASVVASAVPEIDPKLTVPADAKPFVATLEGKTYLFKSAWIVSAMEYGWLFLSTGDATCSTETAGVTRLEIDLHAGPGDRLYAGHPIAVSVNVDPFLEKKKLGESWIGTPFATLLVDAGATWTKGGRVRASLDFDYEVEHGAVIDEYSGSGAFDAVVCDERTQWWWHGGPSQVSAGAVTGSYAGAAFTAKSAIAIVMHDDRNGVTYIDTIRLYPVENVGCEQREAQEKSAPYVQLSGPVAGANDRQRFARTSQPTSAFYYTPPAIPDAWPVAHAIQGDAWVRFDGVETEVGKTLRGAMFVSATKSEDVDADARLEGTFDARVCKW